MSVSPVGSRAIIQEISQVQLPESGGARLLSIATMKEVGEGEGSSLNVRARSCAVPAAMSASMHPLLKSRPADIHPLQTRFPASWWMKPYNQVGR